MNVITKTRGDVPPFGKPRVVICPHGLYRGGEAEVAEDLLEAADVAVSYLAGWAIVEGAELDRYLEGARLVVCLLDRERLVPLVVNQETFLKAAEARGIPILPILCYDCMGDEECAKNYRRLLGNRQYVSAWLDGYREELREYLSALMADEDTRRTVAGAFRGRLFLSYRKRDGEAAAKLLHLLHNLPDMEDVAVWIDDYLTPGEDFSDEIREALVGSDAVILCVTPNLLEMDNYVARVEYPLAKERGIPVLPVVMEEPRGKFFRDGFLDALGMMYPALCDGGVFHAEKMAALYRTLEAILPPRGERSAEKAYHLGLGYFYGIEVEQDKSRAIGLFCEAAEKGSPLAAEKLAELFEGKQGIEASEEKRVHYLRIAADQREAALLAAHERGEVTEEDAKKAFRARRRLADRLFHGKEISASLEATEAMYALAERVLLDGDLLDYARAEYWSGRARCQRARGAWEDALAAAEKAIVLWQSTVDAKRDAAFQQGLGSTLLEKSLLLSRMGDREAALSAAEEAVSVLESSARENRHEDNDWTLHALSVLAERYDEVGRQSQAEDCARRLVREADLLLAQSPNPYRRRLLCRGLKMQGRCAILAERYAEATALFRRIYDETRRETGNEASCKDSSRLCESAADLARALLWEEKGAEAIPLFCEAEQWAAQTSPEGESLLSLGILAEKCAVLYRLPDRRAEADATFARCLEAYRRRAETERTAAVAKELAYLLRVGAGHATEPEALEYFGESVSRLRPFLKEGGGILEEYLRAVWGRVTRLYQKEEWDLCRLETEDAIACAAPFLGQRGVKEQVARLHSKLGDLYYREKEGEGNAPRALSAYRTVLASANRVGDMGIKVDLVAWRVYELARDARDLSALLSALPHLSGTAAELALWNEQARDLLWEAGKKREAIRCALTAIDHRETVFRRTMTEEARAKLAEARAWHAAHTAPTVAVPRPQTAPKPPSAKKPPKKKGFWARFFGGK